MGAGPAADAAVLVDHWPGAAAGLEPKADRAMFAEILASPAGHALDGQAVRLQGRDPVPTLARFHRQGAGLAGENADLAKGAFAASHGEFGTAILAAVLVVLALTGLEGTRSVLMISGASLYLASIVITATFNVPLNDRLAAVDPATSAGRSTWDEYQRRWTRGNHMRVVVCIGSMVVLIASILA